jgi:glycosyltransferase involved in cell wall biosynthesis
MKKDKRIKLIENQKNRKILFCKSLGALYSKGKYIIELDQDDMFIRNDAFNILYKIGENGNLDLLHFNFIAGKNVFHLPIIFNSRESFYIKKQPELKYSLFKNNNSNNYQNNKFR